MTRQASAWRHRLAVLTAAATLVLIVAGGLVTNTGAALAVPDWPTTFGHNMFLFPWSGMIGGVFYEHTHRLLGALVGLLTLALSAGVWLGEPRRWVRGLGLLAVILVIVQGLLGGLRVVWLRDGLAIVHGCLAHAFFALLVALTVVTSRSWLAPPPGGSPAGGTWWLAAGAAAALYGQVVLGALTTHAGWVTAHLAGAVVAVVLATALLHRVLAPQGGDPALARLAALLGGLMVGQLALGLGAYLARFTGLAIPGGAAVALALPVVHRVIAALLLGTAVALALRAGRRRAAEGRRVPVGGGLASGEAAA